MGTDSIRKIELIKKDINTLIYKMSKKKPFHASLGPFIDEANKLLLSQDAKRIRGIFPVLIGDSLNLDGESTVLYGVVLELLHFTSLIHDDVIDDHPFRRGYPTLNHTFARNHAVLIGDFMMCEVISHSLNGKYSNRVIELLVEAVKKLVTGVIMEQNVLDREPTLEKYLEMVMHKTSSLFRLSFCLPFVADERFSQAALCGEKFGLLFQIFDDYLDRHSDNSYENIFHISSQDTIQHLWDETYNQLLDESQRIRIDTVVLDMVAYLQTQGYFVGFKNL
jgi:geranylgeranyl pyrophosphate synthase